MDRRLLLLVLAPVSLVALESKPWLASAYEFYFNSAYTYSRFDQVHHATHQLRTPWNNNLISCGLGFIPSDGWELEAEVELAATPRQTFGYRSAAIQGRYQWLNDIVGDPVSCASGVVLRDVSTTSLHDISCPYSFLVNLELNTSIGKEWSKGPFWSMRTWAQVAVGVANRGMPWINGLCCFEKNWDNRHRILLFAEADFGFGAREHVDVDHFFGWGKYHHQSVDVGAGYQYHFDLWGDLTLSYARRVYAHTFPEQVNFFTLSYHLPFSPF